MQSLTPILTVDSIEDSLPFWTDRLGFECTVTVPDAEDASAPLTIGFAILVKEGLEVMLQTYRSIAQDLPTLAEERGTAFLYLKVDDLDAMEERLEGAEVVVPRRTTFYGAEEVWVREPGGHVVGFAQFAAQEEQA